MPWKRSHVEEERMKFIAEYLREDSDWNMSELCEAFGISRKSGYKWIERYDVGGLDGLKDQSRAAQQHPNAIAEAVVRAVLAARQAHRFWGPRKLVAWLTQKHPGTEWPAASTAGDILKRHGLVEPRRRRRQLGTPRSALSVPSGPNQVWGVDYKGWFRTADGQRCDPLTISDLFSRFLLECRRVQRTDERCARAVFERVFRAYGLPAALRSDNGPPFASPGLGGLSKLSVWWVKLGIRLERIAPGCPEQNGRHERMHQTLKRETACPPRATAAAQQRAFNEFRALFNSQRPHEALQDTPPAQWYERSGRPYPAREPSVEYPAHFEVRQVRSTGEIKWRGAFVYLSEALIGEPVGLEAVSDRHWVVQFGPVKLAVLDDHGCKLLPYRPVVQREGPARAVVENSSRPSGSFRFPQLRRSEAE